LSNASKVGSADLAVPNKNDPHTSQKHGDSLGRDGLPGRPSFFFGVPSPRRRELVVAPYQRPFLWNLFEAESKPAPAGPPAHCLRISFSPAVTLTPSYRRSALRAEIIENFAVRQD
jgi:hypothetical protein